LVNEKREGKGAGKEKESGREWGWEIGKETEKKE